MTTQEAREQRAMREGTEPADALIYADWLADHDAYAVEVQRWRMYGEWLAEVTAQVEAVERRWPELMTDRKALRRIPATQRHVCFSLPGGVAVRMMVAFRMLGVTLERVANMPFRTYDLHRSCLASEQRARYLRNRVRQMVDDYLQHVSPAR